MHAFIAMIATQGLAFLVLFLILKKFAFGPVLNVIDSRRKHISDEFDKIEASKAEMMKAQRELEQRLAKIEDEARIRVRDAVQEGQKMADEIRAHAQAEAQAFAQKTMQLIELERAKATVEMRQQIVALTVAATEKLLHEKLDDQKHRELISKFIETMPTTRT